MIYWNEKINGSLAMQILELCIEQMIEKDKNNGDGCKPAGKAKCYLDTLHFNNGVWFIWYNDSEGSTHTAGIEIEV